MQKEKKKWYFCHSYEIVKFGLIWNICHYFVGKLEGGEQDNIWGENTPMPPMAPPLLIVVYWFIQIEM